MTTGLERVGPGGGPVPSPGDLPAERRPIWRGTSGPSVATPGRRAGSVRRTVTVDVPAPESARPAVVGRGRDLLTPPDRPPAVLGATELGLRVERRSRQVLEASATPGVAALGEALVGTAVGGPLRRLARELPLPDGSLVAALLDDIPPVLMIAGSAIARAERQRGGSTAGFASVEQAPIDVCAGWAAGGSMVRALPIRPFLGEGPPAPPDASEDPWAWHDQPELPPGGLRRRRRIDLWAPDGPSGPALVDAEFRTLRSSGTGSRRSCTSTAWPLSSRAGSSRRSSPRRTSCPPPNARRRPPAPDGSSACRSMPWPSARGASCGAPRPAPTSRTPCGRSAPPTPWSAGCPGRVCRVVTRWRAMHRRGSCGRPHILGAVRFRLRGGRP